MTKAELIRKLAKRSGVPDQETKIFFELFLQKASASLKRGEAVKLNGIGYFQLRQGIIKGSLREPEENIIFSDLMVFFPMQNDEINSEESLIFNVPISKEDDFNEVDSYFSLSIGKPIIPLEGVNETEYFSPPSSYELKKLMETKVDKLLQSAEVINKYIKGNEVLIIESEKPGNDQFEFDWTEKKEEKKLSPEIERQITTEMNQRSEFEHLAWNFGDDLSKQIEEESIIDSANINELIPDALEEEKNLEWNFGLYGDKDNSPDNREVNIGINKEQTGNEFESHDNYEETNDYDKISPDKFELVKSITSAMEDNQDELKKIREPEDEEKSADTFHLSGSENEISVGKEEFSEEPLPEDHEKYTTEEQTHSINEEGETNLINLDEPQISKAKEQEFSAKNQKEVPRFNNNKHYDKRNSSIVFIIALITIIVVGAALFMYLKQGGLLSSGVTVNQERHGVMPAPASTPVIIERKYEVPVTYPYPPKENKDTLKTGPDNSSGVNALSGGNDVRGKNKDKENTDNEATLPPQKSIESHAIKDYIIKSGEHYVVQISSWQSGFVAKKEAEKFNNKGYKSFVEKTNVKGKGTWYRVKVGNFNTLMEAQQFFKKNQ